MPTTTACSSLGKISAEPRGGPGNANTRVVSPRLLRWFPCLASLMFLALLPCGCTSLREYIGNGFKVGPNYKKPPAPVAREWIDAADVRVRQDADDLSKWWTAFKDPVLDNLICFAYGQNLSLRAAGFRVLEARAQLGIDVGNIFPQTQAAKGDFQWNGLSRETANNFLNFGLPGVTS